jgi:hypothetical protein
MPTELRNAHTGIKFFVFEISFDFYIFIIILFFWLCLVKTMCNNSANKAGLLYSHMYSHIFTYEFL